MQLEPEANSPPEFALKCAAYNLGATIVSIILGVYALGQGISIIIGGPPRFSGPSYQVALSVPGAPAIWGVVLILAGVAIAVGLAFKRPFFTTWGMVLGGFWSMLFAVAFAAAAHKRPDANLTAMWVYGKDALVYLAFGVVFHSSYYRKKGSHEIQKHDQQL